MDWHWTADEVVANFLYLHTTGELESRDALEITFSLVAVCERIMPVCPLDRREDFLAQCFVELLPAVERKLNA